MLMVPPEGGAREMLLIPMAKCGVPQGSILVPVLFDIYLTLLGEAMQGFVVRCHPNAVDMQLYFSLVCESGGLWMS